MHCAAGKDRTGIAVALFHKNHWGGDRRYIRRLSSNQ
ncbi:tyrosine-protein phosphatase [Sphingobium sp. Ant17]